MPASGDRYDRFLVEDVLGQGGMATVYRVRHGTLGSHHALKVLDLPFPAIRARLVQEGQVQARLRHPHIVAVTDLIDVDGSPGLIMEYVSGPTLEAWLGEHHADAVTAVGIFSAVLDAVAFAHREGLIHRDLKPGNVLLQLVDGRIIPKVTDFGLAKLLTADAANLRTRTGFAMGTPGYMAPEQVRSAKDVDARADVYALGCILYELWCGARAFSGDDLFATLERMEARAYVDPRELRPDIPDAVVAAIHGALEPDRDRRLPSCEAIRAVLDGGPCPAPVHAGAGPTKPPPPSLATYALPADSSATLILDSDIATIAPRSVARRSTVVGLGVGIGAVFVAGSLAVCAGAIWWVSSAGPTVSMVSTEGVSTEAAEPSSVGVPVVAPAAPAADVTPADVPPAAPAGSVGGTAGAARSEPAAPFTPDSRAPSVVPPEAPPAPTDPTRASSPPTTSSPPTASSPSTMSSPSTASAPAAAPPADAAPKAAGRFVTDGAADSVWLEADGRRFGQGSVAPGDYTLHARFGTVEVERKVRVVAGQTLRATCDATFFDCVVR